MQSGWIKYGEKWQDISQSKAKIQRKMSLKKQEITAENIYRLKKNFTRRKKWMAKNN